MQPRSRQREYERSSVCWSINSVTFLMFHSAAETMASSNIVRSANCMRPTHTRSPSHSVQVSRSRSVSHNVPAGSKPELEPGDADLPAVVLVLDARLRKRLGFSAAICVPTLQQGIVAADGAAHSLGCLQGTSRHERAWVPRPTQSQQCWCSRTPRTGTGTSSWCWTS